MSDLAGRLQELEQMVREAKSMPLSSSVLVNRDEFIAILQEMQENLPEEIKQARWVVKDREDLLAKARAEADRIVEQAREEQRRMALKEDVAKRAEAEAAQVLQAAEDKAATMQHEAEDYVDGKLAQFETALRRILEEAQAATRGLAKTLDQVEVGRERLRAPATVAEERLSPPESDMWDGPGEEGPETPLFDDDEGTS